MIHCIFKNEIKLFFACMSSKREHGQTVQYIPLQEKNTLYLNAWFSQANVHHINAQLEMIFLHLQSLQ